jgi:hypothetical protein
VRNAFTGSLIAVDLKEEQILGDRVGDHWYYRAKAEALQRLLESDGRRGGTILDVGAGSAFFSRWLLEHTDACRSICVDAAYSHEYETTHLGKPIVFQRQCDTVGAGLMLLMDVLEHVPDDVGLLREYAAKVPPGTPVVVTVPAFSFLWSGHDEFLGHLRRYTLQQAEQMIRSAGLTCRSGSYYFGALFPLIVAFRLGQNLLRNRSEAVSSDLSMPSPLVNSCLHTICRLEQPFFRLNRMAGLSVFCLAHT